jgi:hypothetical protein
MWVTKLGGGGGLEVGIGVMWAVPSCVGRGRGALPSEAMIGVVLEERVVPTRNHQ